MLEKILQTMKFENKGDFYFKLGNNEANVDYGDLTTITADAFGVSLGVNYDCMEPVGSLVYEDFGVLP